MRADRLLSVLILLQTRGRMTAAELADALEVSERTIYRDIDALTTAGVPVYGAPGRDGGYALLDGYRTSLTGLNEAELAALAILSAPAPLEGLGFRQTLSSALLKLSAALPEAQREAASHIRQRIHLDAAWWRQSDEIAPHLEAAHDAVRRDHRLRIRYRAMPRLELEQTVEPYGLVAKAGVWYLVWARSDKLHVQRVSTLLEAAPTGETFVRPPTFDLERFWRAWCAAHESQLSDYRALVRVRPEAIGILARSFGERIREQAASATPDETGRVTLEISFASLEAARDRLLAFGRACEVLSPQALRLSIIDFAEQLLGAYRSDAPPAQP